MSIPNFPVRFSSDELLSAQHWIVFKWQVLLHIKRSSCKKIRQNVLFQHIFQGKAWLFALSNSHASKHIEKDSIFPEITQCSLVTIWFSEHHKWVSSDAGDDFVFLDLRSIFTIFFTSQNSSMQQSETISVNCIATKISSELFVVNKMSEPGCMRWFDTSLFFLRLWGSTLCQNWP